MDVPIKINKNLNKDKYVNAVLYFLTECNNSYLGRTKLNKLFYYLDFISYRDRGFSVTNDDYTHKDLGPVPQELEDNVIPAMHEVDLIKHDIGKQGFNRSTFQVKSKYDLNVFDNYEKHLLRRICETFVSWETDKIVAQTHLEAPWIYSSPYKFINFEEADDIDLFEDLKELVNNV